MESNIDHLKGPLEQLAKQGKLEAQSDQIKELLANIDFIEEFICCICISGAIYQPVECRNCNQLFCQSCLDKFKNAQNSKGEPVFCPHCKVKPFEKGQLNKLVMSLINKFTIMNCPCGVTECTATLLMDQEKTTYERLIPHLQHKCISVIINCPMNGCNLKMKRIDLPLHFQSCKYFLLCCQVCEKHYSFANYSNHNCAAELKLINTQLQKQLVQFKEEQRILLQSKIQEGQKTNDELRLLRQQLLSKDALMKQNEKKFFDQISELSTQVKNLQEQLNREDKSSEEVKQPIKLICSQHNWIDDNVPCDLPLKLVKGELFAKYQITSAKKCLSCQILKSNSQTIVHKGFCTSNQEILNIKLGDPLYFKCSKRCDVCRNNIPKMRDPLAHKHCYNCKTNFQQIIDKQVEKSIHESKESHRVLGSRSSEYKFVLCIQCLYKLSQQYKNYIE